MKRLFSLLICLLLTSVVWAQKQDVSFVIISEDNEGVTVRVDMPAYLSLQVQIDDDEYNRLLQGNAYCIDKKGAPELLLSAKSLIIPANSTPTLTIENEDYEVVENFLLAPSKGVIYRNENPSDIPYSFGAEYQRNSYQMEKAASLTNTFKLRDNKGVTIQAYPFDYNPVKKQLKVYHSLTVRVHYNCVYSSNLSRKNCKEFDAINRNLFLNYEPSRYAQLMESGEILVISPRNFMNAMQPYVDWKIKNGYVTTMVALEDIGSTASEVKSYITDFYNARNLVFVVIVGDGNQFPYFTIGGEVCDNYYTEIDGDDDVPDIILGKISAEYAEQVSIQVEKFIQYERNPQEVSHFDKFCGIASTEGTGDNDEYDYQHIRNIDNKLMNFTYVPGYEFFEGSQGGLDASGNPTPTMVKNAINDGVGIITYCGHGSSDRWGSSNFSNLNISQLMNYGKLPFIISVACLNGNYVGQTCFAEVWLRSHNNAQQTGAVGAMMSTMSQPWNPPMCGQDEMVRALAGIEHVDARHTFGGLAFSGLLKMYENYHNSSGLETMRTWVLFGDPAMQVRTAVPQQLVVTHQNEVIMGESQISVACSVEGAKAVLTLADEILDQAFITNGIAMLNLPPTLVQTDTLHLLVSAFNYIPYEADVTLTMYNNPYLICSEHTVSGSTGELHPRNGEIVEMSIIVTNAGNVDSDTFTATLNTDDPYVSMIEATATHAGINSQENVFIENAFRFKVSSSVPFGHVIMFRIDFDTDTLHSFTNRSQYAYAPDLHLEDCMVDDSQSGDNANGRLDFGESAVIRIPYSNLGDVSAPHGVISVTNFSQDVVQIQTIDPTVPGLESRESGTFDIAVTVNPSVTSPTPIQLEVNYFAGRYSVSRQYKLMVGLNVENWEKGTFYSYAWQNHSENPWTITALHPYEGVYSARSAAIEDNQQSSLKISANLVTADSLSFFYYVSCEQGFSTPYDRLEFYINDERQDYWDGEVYWDKAAYNLNPGNYTFEWRYVKDYMQSAGEDLAMIDNIVLPKSVLPATETDNIEPLSVSCYPNPTKDVVVLDMNTDFIRQASADIFDIYGRFVKRISISNNHCTIDFSELSSGIYIIDVNNDGKRLQMLKIVKE